MPHSRPLPSATDAKSEGEAGQRGAVSQLNTGCWLAASLKAHEAEPETAAEALTRRPHRRPWMSATLLKVVGAESQAGLACGGQGSAGF